MIIGAEFLDGQICAMRCMNVVVETIRGTVCILGQNRPPFDAAEADFHKASAPDDKPPDPETEALSLSYIMAAKTIRVLPITEIPVLIRCEIPCIVNR